MLQVCAPLRPLALARAYMAVMAANALSDILAAVAVGVDVSFIKTGSHAEIIALASNHRKCL